MIEQEYVRVRILNRWFLKVGGLRVFPLEREIAEIILTRQESFDLVKEVGRHFVIISIECKSKIVASIIRWRWMMILGCEMFFGLMHGVGQRMNSSVMLLRLIRRT